MVKGRPDCPIFIHNLKRGDTFCDAGERMFIMIGKRKETDGYMIVGLDDGKFYHANEYDRVFLIDVEGSYI